MPSPWGTYPEEDMHDALEYLCKENDDLRARLAAVERDRNEARKDLVRLSKGEAEAVAAVKALKRERDEAREELRLCEQGHAEAVRLMQQAQAERDRAIVGVAMLVDSVRRLIAVVREVVSARMLNAMWREGA